MNCAGRGRRWVEERHGLDEGQRLCGERLRCGRARSHCCSSVKAKMSEMSFSNFKYGAAKKASWSCGFLVFASVCNNSGARLAMVFMETLLDVVVSINFKTSPARAAARES